MLGGNIVDIPIGWAEPEQIIGTPRMQQVEGFYYFYIEQIHPAQGEKEEPVDSMIERLGRLFEQYSPVSKPPLLVMFFLVEGEGPYQYDIQVGYVISKEIPVGGEAKVRYVPPTLCGSLVACGDVQVFANSYKPLLDFVDSQGYLAVEGFRETCLYWEGEQSKNNIIWIQHPARAK
jgi:hypothetical protein